MNQCDFALLNQKKAEEMRKVIEEAAMQGDSVGGIIETCVLHMPEGIGEPFFDSIESHISHLLFSVPAVKRSRIWRRF